ncbi:VanZ family protein [Streptomyces sp. NPDC092296]|uniref:VanZ family protein n=1 Tax=Streptomyces sp. NPDC092296 TaxID=3366012 RepID=UPI0037FBA19C
MPAYRDEAPVWPLLRTTGLLLLAAHLLLVAWFALRPVPAAWIYDANLQPFSSIRRDLSTGSAGEYRRLVLELLLMAPLGVLLPMAGGRVRVSWLPSLLRTVGAAALICTGLEFAQTGVPGHVLNVDDVLLNLAGVTLVHLAVVPGARALLRHRGDPPTGPGAPTPAEPARPPRQRHPAPGGRPTSTPYEALPAPTGR